MPLNLIKRYNAHLDLASMNPRQRDESLKGVFRRDVVNNQSFVFKTKQIHPTPKDDGIDALENLFNHLTRKVVDEKTKAREFDMHRSVRLHWIKHHVDERKSNNMIVFSVKEPKGNRTYIYDRDEKYVIVLEPLRKIDEYYLLTAFPVMGKDAARKTYEKKYKRRLPNIL
jgi:hypothetical protein